MLFPRLLLAAASLTTLAFADEPYRFTKAELIELAAKAPEALHAPIATVVDKPQASPSGDAHDYVSFARYYWPDPSKPDGLPYLSHDGKHNEAQVAKGDHERLWKFAESVEALAAAWQVNHDEAAARRAGEWLRAWFITPATRMNPNMEFAQVRLGHDHNHGSSSGVLDSRCFSGVIESLLLLHGSPAFADGEEAAIQAWFKAYLEWLNTAKNAVAEHNAKNNHGSWFLAQIIPIARYSGRDDLARQLVVRGGQGAHREPVQARWKPAGGNPPGRWARLQPVQPRRPISSRAFGERTRR